MSVDKQLIVDLVCAYDVTAIAVKLARRRLGEQFDRHIYNNHNADFEVCPDEYCQMAYSIGFLLYALGEMP